jgi:hypothetical protein
MGYGQAAGIAMAVGLAFTGCATSDGTGPSSAAKTAGLGTLAGAGLGAIIGHQSGNTAEGAAIGAGAGAVGGYILGNEKDKAQTQSQVNAAQEQANQAMIQANTVVINVTNSNGSITPVTLTRQGNLYVGPKGEQYTSLPTEDQLRKVYGF